jgi:hypothetical protein
MGNNKGMQNCDEKYHEPFGGNIEVGCYVHGVEPLGSRIRSKC